MSAVQAIVAASAGRISLREAIAIAHSAARPLPAEVVLLEAARDRILARPIRAMEDLVPFARSAMDGYAVRSEDTVGAKDFPLMLPVHRSIYAGDLPVLLAPKTAIGIATGAPLPLGADAVVPWEEVSVREGSIELQRPVAAAAHVFPSGDDARRGDIIARAGEPLTPGRAAMLASAGISCVSVHRRPRVGIVCTGDEIVDVGTRPLPGQVRNSNATMLAFHAAADGAVVVTVRHVDDTADQLRAALATAIASCDLVMTTGGASTGERDLVKGVLASLGARFAFTSISMRPSKPMAFACTSGAIVSVLPGNPAAAFVGYVTLIRGVVRRLGGRSDCTPQQVRAVIDGAVHGKRDRDFFAFASLRHDGTQFVVRPLDNQCSSLVRTSADANALIHVPPGETTFTSGSQLHVEVLDWASVRFAGSGRGD